MSIDLTLRAFGVLYVDDANAADDDAYANADGADACATSTQESRRLGFMPKKTVDPKGENQPFEVRYHYTGVNSTV